MTSNGRKPDGGNKQTICGRRLVTLYGEIKVMLRHKAVCVGDWDGARGVQCPAWMQHIHAYTSYSLTVHHTVSIWQPSAKHLEACLIIFHGNSKQKRL